MSNPPFLRGKTTTFNDLTQDDALFYLLGTAPSEVVDASGADDIELLRSCGLLVERNGILYAHKALTTELYSVKDDPLKFLPFLNKVLRARHERLKQALRGLPPSLALYRALDEEKIAVETAIGRIGDKLK